jgi:hypothetical protein
MDAQNTLPLKRLTIFKNSTCLITREGKIPITGGVARLPIPSEALFGGYWIASPNNVIQSLTFKSDKLEESEPAKDIYQYLAGNIGKKLTIVTNLKEAGPTTGKLIDFNKETLLLKVKQDNGRLTLLPAQNIHQVDFLEEVNNSFVKDSIQRMVILKPEKTANEILLQQLSMQAGVNWVPSYLLKLKDEKSARLEMKATVENGVEDIINGETELVVGAPQMYFGQRRDPITYDYLTEGDVRQDFSGMGAQMLSNSMRSREIASESESAFDGEFATEGEKAGDLYIYKIGKISLPKNSKGTYPVFAAPVDYAHKYEVLIADHTNFISNRYVQPGEVNLDVIHSLAIKNTSSVPLTTAPVMVVTEKEQFLAQDLLKYTPVNGSVDIKLSKALDIVIKSSEEEIDRKEEAKKAYGYNYGRIVIKGTLTLSNLQKKEVTVHVRKVVTGNIIKLSDNGKVTKERISTDNNPVSALDWDVKMSVNSQKTITYEYEVFYRQ